MLETRAPKPEQPVNVPDERAEHINWQEPCKRCQVECDYCLGWRVLYQQEQAKEAPETDLSNVYPCNF